MMNILHICAAVESSDLQQNQSMAGFFGWLAGFSPF
jgi:hypothetical protein